MSQFCYGLRVAEAMEFRETCALGALCETRCRSRPCTGPVPPRESSSVREWCSDDLSEATHYYKLTADQAFGMLNSATLFFLRTAKAFP
jgi:hypothetical protein